jgi:hypothetical protein
MPQILAAMGAGNTAGPARFAEFSGFFGLDDGFEGAAAKAVDRRRHPMQQDCRPRPQLSYLDQGRAIAHLTGRLWFILRFVPFASRHCPAPPIITRFSSRVLCAAPEPSWTRSQR